MSFQPTCGLENTFPFINGCLDKVMKQSAYIIKWVFGKIWERTKAVFLLKYVPDTNPDFGISGPLHAMIC